MTLINLMRFAAISQGYDEWHCLCLPSYYSTTAACGRHTSLPGCLDMMSIWFDSKGIKKGATLLAHTVELAEHVKGFFFS